MSQLVYDRVQGYLTRLKLARIQDYLDPLAETGPIWNSWTNCWKPKSPLAMNGM